MGSDHSEGEDWLQKRRSDLLEELRKYARKRWFWGEFDKWLHFVLIVASIGASGFAAIAVYVSPGGESVTRPVVAGIAAIPALAIALAQQLHCVAAANLHFRSAQRADALRRKLKYELPPSLREKQLAEVSAAFAKIEEDATAFWEKETADAARTRRHARK
jgi:hypothetical protein